MELSGVLNVIAVSLAKLGNDIHLLGRAPGLSELDRAASGLSSSIMPGKTNPTRSGGADDTVAAQVMGNHVTVTITSTGHLELNVFDLGLMIQNVLHSCALLAIPQSVSAA